MVATFCAICAAFGIAMGSIFALPIGIIIGERHSKVEPVAPVYGKNQGYAPANKINTGGTGGVPNTPWGPNVRFVGPDGLPLKR